MIEFTEKLKEALMKASEECRERRLKYLTPEHVVYMLLGQQELCNAMTTVGGDPDTARKCLREYVDALDDKFAEDEEMPVSVRMSEQGNTLIDSCAMQLEDSSAEKISVSMLVSNILDLEDSEAAWALTHTLEGDRGELLSAIMDEYQERRGMRKQKTTRSRLDINTMFVTEKVPKNGLSMATCINIHLDPSKPLVGREKELERTIQVLCRREKNNPLHIGDAGVGKTALIYGLAQRIKDGNVPECLRGSLIFSVNVGDLVSGTQYRGDFERNLKELLKEISRFKNPIIYFDEIHNLNGAGRAGDSSIDAGNMLKPWLESGKIRFIGATTYEEYNKYFQTSRALVRRFQQIDIAEPSVEETIEIARQLKGGYEEFHGVEYDDEALVYAVKGTARHLPDRRLPDKALDLIDEAGAWQQMHRGEDGDAKRVDVSLMADVLARMCKVSSLAVKDSDGERMATLRDRIAARVFGQDDAVDAVAEAVLTGKAGLIDEDKPLASLLFVGPTGVGKTEVAKVLADEMGVELIRFDMSEYTEKHTVAKLIGAPAGYVGYEEGGLLTDAIRRNPNCVLLLDEIEKAHSDIYNILLQVMDYARLTDNHGRSADFRNVVLIMTSNAGAQYASQAKVGFGSTATAGQAMLKEVKRIFKPEFINRLSSAVIFREMDTAMASLILDKKLGALRRLLEAKGVTLTLGEEARALLLKESFTREYGAREMDRVIASRLKPMLTRAILFGNLAGGGEAVVEADGSGNLTLNVNVSKS